MNSMHARPSLMDLRNKTDRQLLALAGREMDRALDYAYRGDWARADAGCARAEVLLNIACASTRERSEMEARLAQARAAIARAPAEPGRLTQSACG